MLEQFSVRAGNTSPLYGSIYIGELMEIRFGSENDINILREILFEACFWNPNSQRPDMDEFLKHPDISKIIANWGRDGDACLIAEYNGKVLGAAWYRFWTEEDHSYGFIEPEIPEIAIGVYPEFRSKGIGRHLLKELISHAKKANIKALSLSVDPNNFARHLYESEGFEKQGESGTSYTYKLDLK